MCKPLLRTTAALPWRPALLGSDFHGDRAGVRPRQGASPGDGTSSNACIRAQFEERSARLAYPARGQPVHREARRRQQADAGHAVTPHTAFPIASETIRSTLFEPSGPDADAGRGDAAVECSVKQRRETDPLGSIVSFREHSSWLRGALAGDN